MVPWRGRGEVFERMSWRASTHQKSQVLQRRAGYEDFLLFVLAPVIDERDSGAVLAAPLDDVLAVEEVLARHLRLDGDVIGRLFRLFEAHVARTSGNDGHFDVVCTKPNRVPAHPVLRVNPYSLIIHYHSFH